MNLFSGPNRCIYSSLEQINTFCGSNRYTYSSLAQTCTTTDFWYIKVHSSILKLVHQQFTGQNGYTHNNLSQTSTPKFPGQTDRPTVLWPKQVNSYISWLNWYVSIYVAQTVTVLSSKEDCTCLSPKQIHSQLFDPNNYIHNNLTWKSEPTILWPKQVNLYIYFLNRYIHRHVAQTGTPTIIWLKKSAPTIPKR